MKFDELSPEERLLAEQAVLNFRSLNSACDAAADGTVLAVAERLAVEQGRELTRRTLQATLDGQVESVEKKWFGPNVRMRTEEISSWSQGQKSHVVCRRIAAVSHLSEVRQMC